MQSLRLLKEEEGNIEDEMTKQSARLPPDSLSDMFCHTFLTRNSSQTLNETEIEKIVRQSKNQLCWGEYYSDSEESSSSSSSSSSEQSDLESNKESELDFSDMPQMRENSITRRLAKSHSNPVTPTIASVNADKLEKHEEDNSDDEAIVSSRTLEQVNFVEKAG